MSRTQRHIKSQTNTINGESYAILQESTNATFISKETMETNEEKKSIRQESKTVSYEPELVENKETEGQAKTESAGEIVENETDISVKDRKTTNADIDSIGKKVEKIPGTLNVEQQASVVDQQRLLDNSITSLYSLEPSEIDGETQKALDDAQQLCVLEDDLLPRRLRTAHGAAQGSRPCTSSVE